MDALLHLVNAWKDLVVKLFSDYPLAGAISIAAGYAAWRYAEKVRNPGKPVINATMALLGWSVATPLLGSTISVFVDLWGVVKDVVPVLKALTVSLYSIYQEHPVMVLALVALAGPAYFAWAHWRPHVMPNRWLRIVSLALGVVVLAYLLAPLIHMVTGEPVPVAISQ